MAASEISVLTNRPKFLLPLDEAMLPAFARVEGDRVADKRNRQRTGRQTSSLIVNVINGKRRDRHSHEHENRHLADGRLQAKLRQNAVF